ncbi:LysE family transporter [Paenibacillus flagellatus]|uniref:Amino acid transporter n=1 Tax=Paenibacillus flagellatus TaxID=2211139 RepID=A0A2V5KMD8_9BACL|nr:LysE family transporter [Paenibacillus flagellatus]PYI52077.1 amino acid transporter [Paenibacillus flagellatus]
MSVFWSYLLLGLSLAAPIGPINAAQIRTGIRSGFVQAWLVGLGAMAADVLYMLLVYMGVVHFIDIAFMKTFLWLFGCFVLVYTGVETLVAAGRLHEGDGTRSDGTSLRSFSSGFVLSATNPLTVLFWLGIYGSVLAESAASLVPGKLLLYSLAIVLGILLWDLFMAGTASGFRRLLSPRFLTIVSIVSGLSLLVFGAYFGLEAFRALFG